MSVAQLSAREIGLMVAILVKQGEKLPDMCEVGEVISRGNCAAWGNTYSDQIYPANADEIEGEALRFLAGDLSAMIDGHFGPIVYNLVSNSGETAEFCEDIRILEERAKQWQSGERLRLERERENNQAYEIVAPLPKMPSSQIQERAKSLGYERVIVAKYRVDESDSYSDYCGSRTARQVVIGFGKGKRENFAQLRKAAGEFEETKHLGPGHDIYRPHVVFAEQIRDKSGRYLYPGQVSPWHHEQSSQTFYTIAEAERWIEECGQPSPIIVGADDEAAILRWDLGHESIEHRENYSMGGGNYLGHSRHGSGWKVSSNLLAHFGSGEIEVAIDLDTYPAANAKPAKRIETKPTQEVEANPPQAETVPDAVFDGFHFLS